MSDLGLQCCGKTLWRKATWGGEWFIATYNCKEENVGQELKVKIWKKKLKQKQWRASYSLDPYVFFTYARITWCAGGHHSQRLASHISISNYEDAPSLAYRPDLWRHFLNCGPLFSDMSRFVPSRFKKKERKQHEQLYSDSNRFVRILCDQSLVLEICKLMRRHTFWILSATWYLFLKITICCFKNNDNSLFWCKTQILIFWFLIYI